MTFSIIIFLYFSFYLFGSIDITFLIDLYIHYFCLLLAEKGGVFMIIA